MKTIIIILVLGVAGYYGYKYFFDKDDAVKITGTIQVSQRSNFDINAPQVSGPLYVAAVHGTAKNTSNKPIKTLFIKYKIAGKPTSTTLFNVSPGQQVQFTTKSVKTRGKNPGYTLETVQYEDSD